MPHQNVVAKSHPATYRPEIDGLRALAVLSVIGFHAFPTLLPGGFIGVDVFFVISGYLISGIIFADVDSGRFSIAEFYSRRIRRIFPALALVLGACMIFGSLFLFPHAAARLGLHTTAGTLFVSNLVLWTESGYFDGDSALKPLLHLWSLGIEEQYYMIWPVLIMACGRRRWARVGLLLTLVAMSFALNVVLLSGHPVSAFYLPVTRFWELLVGAGLAHLALYHRDTLWPARADAVPTGALRERLPDALACAGALLLFIGLASLRADQPFPGWRALLPTAGAVLLIAGGPAAWLNRHVLSSRIAVFFGLISYPLYLWHWPLLTFPKLVDITPSRSIRLAMVFAAVAFAWITYRAVESPIRRSPVRRRTTLALAGIVATIGACGLLVYLTDGIPQRYPEALRATALAQMKFDYSAYRGERCLLDEHQGPQNLGAECVEGTSAGHEKLIMIWGDSHAAALYPGMRSVITEEHLPYRLAQYTASVCPPVLGFKMLSRPHCEANNDFALAFIERERPDTVVMLASWSFYNGTAYEKLALVDLTKTVEKLQALGIRNVVVLGPLPRWTEVQPDIVLREWQRTGTVIERSNVRFDPNVLTHDHALHTAFAGMPSVFLSPVRILCTADGCPMLVREGTQLFPVSWDDAHLTIPGSRAFARGLLPLILR